MKPYNLINRKKVHKIYGIIELEKWHPLMLKNPDNFCAYRIIKILSILCYAHIVFEDKWTIVLYINNYMNGNRFNHLYIFD